jgi:hypothetical protein
MKLRNNDHKHDYTITGILFKHIPSKLRAYVQEVYRSTKCKSMSHGSYGIVRSMSWARGEGWRKNHLKSLGKKHHKH